MTIHQDRPRRLQAVEAPGPGTNGASRTASQPGSWTVMCCAPDGSLYGDPDTKLHGHELDDLVAELPIPDGWKLVAVHGFTSLERAA